jgi:lambda family phage portal protein
MINPIEAAIKIISPGTALRRAQERRALSYYEAGRKDRQKKQRVEKHSGDTALLTAGGSIREQARHLDQNHDLSRGILNTLVQNVIGPYGIGVEPMPRNKNGDLLADFAKQISNRYRIWSERPEVTLKHDRASMERLLARSWLRDGDVFSQVLSGPYKFLQHGTSVQLSIEMIEADMVPFDFNGTYGTNRVVAGVEMDTWKRPVAYHMLKEHPGDFLMTGRMTMSQARKRVPASSILHIMMMDSRIGQTRGVSIFAAILGRLDDLKDYEESERIAAKVAASMAGYIKKGSPDQYELLTDEDGNPVGVEREGSKIESDKDPVLEGVSSKRIRYDDDGNPVGVELDS